MKLLFIAHNKILINLTIWEHQLQQGKQLFLDNQQIFQQKIIIKMEENHQETQKKDLSLIQETLKKLKQSTTIHFKCRKMVN